MGLVGVFAVPYVLQILRGRVLYKYFRLHVERLGTAGALLDPPLVKPASLTCSIEGGGYNVSGVSDQKDHAALRQRLHQERRTYRTVGLSDHKIPFVCNLRKPRAGLVQDERPHGL